MSTNAFTAPMARLRFSQRWIRSLVVHLVSCLLGLAVGVTVITLACVGAGTLILWVGFPLLLVAFLIAFGYGRVKRALALWQGAEPWEDLAGLPTTGGPVRRMMAIFRTPQRWRELAYAGIGSILDWVIALTIVAMPVFAVQEIIFAVVPWAHGIWEDAISRWGLWQHSGYISAGAVFTSDASWISTPADIVTGIIILAVWIPLVRLGSRIQIGLTRLFLAPDRKTIATRLASVEQAHSAGQTAESVSLSRIERDLHDGPQQSLIRTGLDLAAVERRLEAGDIAGAGAILAELRVRNDATLAEIRTLSRGFAPPILADKGLSEAVNSLAAASPIPTMVCADLTGPRPPEAIERAVYFAISESLANAAKHSSASSIWVDLRQAGPTITATIADNGTGGAMLLPGHGLSGLAERLSSVGGTLKLDSPGAHGTTVRVEVTLR